MCHKKVHCCSHKISQKLSGGPANCQMILSLKLCTFRTYKMTHLHFTKLRKLTAISETS